MSVEVTVSLPRVRMPTSGRWAAAIREAGFAVDLTPAFDVDQFSGFLPCTYEGRPSGFEYYSTRLGHEERSAVGAPDEHDFSVTLVTHSDFSELAVSTIAAAVQCE